VNGLSFDYGGRLTSDNPSRLGRAECTFGTKYDRKAVTKMERGMRVLIAEGDKVFLDIAQDYLSHCGLEVNIATNGVEAIAALRRDLPDVVVLDRELPWGGEDGVRALMGQVPRLSEIPVILTSSDVLPEESGSLASPPILARLRKPYRLRELLARLRECSLSNTTSSSSALVQEARS
jgi:CheY-like chemotaxis protein